MSVEGAAFSGLQYNKRRQAANRRVDQPVVVVTNQNVLRILTGPRTTRRAALAVAEAASSLVRALMKSVAFFWVDMRWLFPEGQALASAGLSSASFSFRPRSLPRLQLPPLLWLTLRMPQRQLREQTQRRPLAWLPLSVLRSALRSRHLRARCRQSSGVF